MVSNEEELAEFLVLKVVWQVLKVMLEEVEEEALMILGYCYSLLEEEAVAGEADVLRSLYV